MNENFDYDKIREEVPEFKERVEIGTRVLTRLLRESENVLIIAFELNEEEERGKIDQVLHTAPGLAEKVLEAALAFYHQEDAKQKEVLVTPS